MARDTKVKPVRDRRIKKCANESCIIHKNNRTFEPEDLYCTVCQEPLVYACVRCGKIFESKGIDDVICDTCKEAIAGKQAKRKAQMDMIGKGAGKAVKIAGTAATVIAVPGGKIGKAAAVAAAAAKAMKK